jgi:PKD repeat protein
MKIYYILLIFFSFGCSRNKIDPSSPPESDFTYKIKDNGNVEFINNSKNSLTYYWDFGDGETSDKKSPIHSFFINNTYTVKLTCINPNSKVTNAKSIVINNTNKLISTNEYSKLFPENGYFNDPLNENNSKAGTIKYKINNLIGATYPNESPPFYNLTTKELFLGYWIDIIRDPNKTTQVYFTPTANNVFASKDAFLNMKPNFRSSYISSFQSSNFNVIEQVPFTEIDGKWTVKEFSKNRLTGIYIGKFISDKNKSYDVKFEFDSLFISFQ